MNSVEKSNKEIFEMAKILEYLKRELTGKRSPEVRVPHTLPG